MDNFSLELIRGTPTHLKEVELVERKGVGHPDYICDAVMESISVALSRVYIKEFGDVLHHNIDKGLLVAGSVEKDFGVGRIITPMELIIGDRATFSVGRKKIDVEAVAKECVKRWFRENLKRVDPERDVKVRVVLKPGSVELQEIFKEKERIKAANDTSAAVGYAPLTPVERAVYECERFLNSTAFKTSFPETGEDVKVMGFRYREELNLTVAMPFMAEMIRSEKEYFSKKKEVLTALKRFAKGLPFRRVNIDFNTLDRPGRGIGGVYLTVLGTSAESADSGQVGRGNRVNGVISLNRPSGSEAAAGKNPVSHVGKIYSILSHLMAKEIYERVDGVAEVYVWLLSEIGLPINRPKSVSVQILSEDTLHYGRVRKDLLKIVDEFMAGIEHLTGELARGEHPIC